MIEKQQAAFRARAPSIMPERNDEYAREEHNWRPPVTLTRWRVRLESATEGMIAALISWPPERLRWSREQKDWAGELYKDGHFSRAGRRYKRAMLDLEVPTEWDETGALA